MHHTVVRTSLVSVRCRSFRGFTFEAKNVANPMTGPIDCTLIEWHIERSDGPAVHRHNSFGLQYGEKRRRQRRQGVGDIPQPKRNESERIKTFMGTTCNADRARNICELSCEIISCRICFSWQPRRCATSPNIIISSSSSIVIVESIPRIESYACAAIIAPHDRRHKRKQKPSNLVEMTASKRACIVDRRHKSRNRIASI